MKILLVEDDATTRCMLLHALQAPGREVYPFEDGEAAWAAFQVERHDLLVIDWILPGMDGLELCRRVRGLVGGDRHAILLITVRNEAGVLRAVLDAGADDFIPKPIDLAMLNVRLAIAEKQVHDRALQLAFERALVLSEQRYRRLTSAVTDYIYAVRVENGQAVETSHGIACFAVTGYSTEEFAANPFLWIQMVYPEDQPAVLRMAERILHGEVPDPLEHRIVRKDGEIRWIRNMLVPHFDADGVLRSYDGLIKDITERRIAEEKQRRLETHMQQVEKLESLGVLAGGIAHDFNNILGAIIGYTTLASEDLSQDNPIYQNLTQALKAADRARELVQEILAFSRQDELARIPVSLGQIVGEVMRLMRASLPATIEIRQQISRQRSTILANATQIHRVIVNLCTNAAHAMREHGGVLEVNLDVVRSSGAQDAPAPGLPAGLYTRLTVSDTGHGIPEEIQERIFEPFFTTKEVGEGTGMGLAMVHGIVTNHSGMVSVESAPGKGATFRIFLPRVSEPDAPAPSPDEKPAKGSEHVLFVDDEQALVQWGKLTLERLGYHVTAMNSSQQALELFRKNPDEFDAVVTDQTMPGMTGDVLARELLTIRPSIPIILATGFSHEGMESTLKTMGVRAVLLKPVPGRELAKTLRSVLNAAQNE